MSEVKAVIRQTTVGIDQPIYKLFVRPVGTISTGSGGGASSWSAITGKPTEFPPEAHTHAIADVTGLQGALDGKAPATHGHAISDVTGLSAALDGKADDAHSHAVSDVSGLQGALDAKQAVLGFTPEDASNKGVAGGYAPLDGTGKVPAVHLPSFVDDVIEAANFAALPGTGEAGKIYVTLDDGKTFRWSGSTYAEISASPGSTDAVPEGATNKYFTTARVLATALTGFAASGTRTAVVATDTILQGFGKVQKYLSDLAAVAFSGSASDLTAGTLPAARFDDTAHGARSGGALHAAASGAAAGFMAAADKTKLDAITGTNTGDQTITLTGDVAGSGTGSFAATIAADAVTNAKLANMPATTIKGNSTGAAADPADLTGTQVTALLDVFASSTKGLVPSPGGTVNTTDFLRRDGTWAAPSGGGGGGAPQIMSWVI